MTDVSRLDDLARAISSQSSKIRAYALAQAAATQAQELEIRRLAAELVVLRGSGSGSRPAANVPVVAVAPSISGSTTAGSTLTASTGTWTNAPTGYTYQWYRCDASGAACVAWAATGAVYVVMAADVGSTFKVAVVASNASGSGVASTSLATSVVSGLSSFGGSLAARIAASTGSDYYVATTGNDTTGTGSFAAPWLTIQKAFNTVPLTGSIVYVRAGTYVSSGNQLTWSRAGSSTNPVTLRAYPGETVTINQTRLYITGSYLRVYGLTIQNPTSGVQDCMKMDAGAHHIDVDGCEFTGAPRQGILLGSAASTVSDIQIWNCRVYGNGGAGLDGQDHGIYTANVNRLMIANCLFYANVNGFGIHLYPDCQAITITCCTVDDHNNSTGAGGGSIIIGTSSGVVNDIKIYACLLTDQDSSRYAVQIFNTVTGVGVYDCIAQDAVAPMFMAASGVTYTNCSTTASGTQYVNKAARDYRLQSSADAIGFAVARSAFVPPTDIDGNARVTADAGCYAA